MSKLFGVGFAYSLPCFEVALFIWFGILELSSLFGISVLFLPFSADFKIKTGYFDDILLSFCSNKI
jgi:hypothetical protein